MKFYKLLIPILLFVVLASACSNGPLPTSVSTATSNLPETTPTEMIPPTETPAPGIVLLIGEPVDADLSAAVEALATETGLGLESRPALAAGEIGMDVKIVVYASPTADVTSLAAGAPDTQFVILSGQDLPAAGNLSVIRSRPEYLLFTAGYITAIIAPDWRAGALLADNTLAGEAAKDVFVNGARYWCGRCAPTYGPVVLFPLVALNPAGSPSSTWISSFATIHENRIEVLYVAPQAASAELFDALLPEGVVLLGNATPDDPAVKARWAVTVKDDVIAPLQTLWPDLLAGNGGQTLNSSVQLLDVNEELFSPGRQERAEEVLATLNDGLINPYSVP